MSAASSKITDPERDDVFEVDADTEVPDPEQAMRDAVASVEAIEREAEHATDVVFDQGADAEGGEPASPEVARLRAEIAEYRERYLRALADSENLRKRVEREREDMRRRAGREILRELLDVVDNLERARAAAGTLDDVHRGVEMIHRHFLEVLRRFGVESYSSVGQPFDPELHEAVSSVETPGAGEPVVVNEMQRGYRLHGTVLRPAMVQVSLPVTSDAGAAGTGSEA